MPETPPQVFLTNTCPEKEKRKGNKEGRGKGREEELTGRESGLCHSSSVIGDTEQLSLAPFTALEHRLVMCPGSLAKPGRELSLCLCLLWEVLDGSSSLNLDGSRSQGERGSLLRSPYRDSLTLSCVAMVTTPEAGKL